MLFGSRARGKARRFSDFDLGVFESARISFQEFSDIQELVAELADDLPVSIDVVNLSMADAKILYSLRNGIEFLGGSPLSFSILQARIHGSKA